MEGMELALGRKQQQNIYCKVTGVLRHRSVQSSAQMRLKAVHRGQCRQLKMN